jgi:iron uptake system component EfeO
MRRLSFVALACLPLGLLAGCTSKSGQQVKVTATDTKCEPSTKSISNGKTTFTVRNSGGKVTEMYVLQGNKTIGEVENIGPGTSRTLTVTLNGGDYELNCKPGQSGNGIKTAIVVSGGSAEGSTKAPDREVEVTAMDYAYTGMTGFSAKQGETIEFKLTNQPTSTEKHEFEVLDADGKNVGEVGETDPGKSGETTITFDKPGTYTYKCGVDDHEAKGMKGTFTVT